MRIHNLFKDADGESHFRDIEVEWVEERNFSKLSKRLPATGIIFRETSGDYDLDWHPAPRRQTSSTWTRRCRSRPATERAASSAREK